MAAQRIRAVQAADMSRSHSEGDLIDFDDDFSSKRLSDNIPASSSSAKSSVCEVVAVRDFSPAVFPALSMQRGDRLSVLDTAGPEWWYARNQRSSGFIPASHVRPLDGGAVPLRRALADSGMVDSGGEGDGAESETEGPHGAGRPRTEAPGHAGGDASTELLLTERQPEPPLANGDAGGRHSCASTGDLLLDRRVASNPFLQSAFTSNPFLSDIVSQGPSSCFDDAENMAAEKTPFDFDARVVQRHGAVSADSEPQRDVAPSGVYGSNDVFAADNSDASACTDLNMEKLLSRQMRSGNGHKPGRQDSGRNSKQRSHSLSELSAMQAVQGGQDKTDPMAPLGKPLAQEFGAPHDRDAYRTAWLQQRQMTRSCHNLGDLCRNLGWGQTQPLQTQAVYRLDGSGGSVQVPETSVRLHAAPLPATASRPDEGDAKEVRLRALLDPPIKLNGDMMTAVSPVVEVRIVGHPAPNALTLEMRVAARVKEDPLSRKCAEIVCLGAENPEGPYALLPGSYVHEDVVQVQLDNKRHCVYVVAVAQMKSSGGLLPWDAGRDAESMTDALVSQPRPVSGTLSAEQRVVSQTARIESGTQSSRAVKTIWDFVQRQMTLAVYGPKHLHPNFTLVLALFGHYEVPSILPSSETNWEGKVGKKSHQQPIGLTLWGKHEFAFDRPRNVDMSLYPSDQNVQVTGSKSGSAKGCCTVRGFQLRLGRVCRAAFQLSLRDASGLGAFALRAQLHGDARELVAQFSVTTPPAAPSGKPPAARRFVKRKELGRSLLLSSSSSASSAAPPPTTLAGPAHRPAAFQEREFAVPVRAVALKTIARQNRSVYFLEYRKGATVGLLSKEKIRARGHAKTKEWYVGYANGSVGLVHCKNVRLLPDGEPVPPAEEPRADTGTLLELLLRPCHSLNFSWSTVSTKVTEGLADWRPLARVLGYSEEEMEESFVREDVDRVSAVVEKLKGDCAGGDGRRRCFLKELFSALLRLDQHAVVVRVLLDCVLLTVSVDLGARWRELAANLASVTRQQAEAYEAPHCQDGVLLPETVWKPAFDFLVMWSSSSREGYWDTLQEMHTALDRTRGHTVARGDRVLTGVLLLAHGLDTLRAQAFPAVDA